ncbi:MAG TPA: winged helix-turn-helix domain-containing protein [Thermoanaerobaculia bacterium]|nr:winged helix-turn-helix domain-containing protein [Thermoanaerobaculia bacterium]
MSDIASLAALLAEPARARMLMALMSGTALTATELALEAGVAPSTASTHLAKLVDARLVTIEKQGRHRYFCLFDDEIASMLEGIHGIATREPKRRGPADPALRHARVCYDHLAGERGVWLFEQLRRRELLTETLTVPAQARPFFTGFGIDLDALASQRRPLSRSCLDWSERRHHLAGSLGTAILQRVFALRWARRELDGRAVVFSATGARAFETLFAGRRGPGR